MDKETKETLVKVAQYATKKEKLVQAKVLYIAIGFAAELLICTYLFAGGIQGTLYGIVPEEICNGILGISYGLAGALLVFWLRFHWAQETPTNETELTVQATVTSKEIVSGTHGAGRSKLGYSFLVHFTTAGGQQLDLFAYEEEYARLHEHTTGSLTYQGRYFVDFEPTA